MEKEDNKIIEEVMKEVRKDGIANVENHNEETLDYNELDIKDYLEKTLKLKNGKIK